MTQRFKAVYFADHPSEDSRQKALTLAFGKNDLPLFNRLKSRSSADIRQFLGHDSFASIKVAAEQEGLAVGTYCLKSLRLKLRNTDQLFLDEEITSDGFPAIQATFRGGTDEPLHAWYPYLEGYSPSFVIEVLNQFAPKAKCIFDPFAGTGTTPLTAAQMGLEAYYAELNPVLQFLIESKVLALSLGAKQRKQLVESLRIVSSEIPKSINSFAADTGLERAYTTVFKDRNYFDKKQLKKVLRIRTLIDELACVDQICARFINVAAISSLVSASNLIRRGDLRFRNENELIDHHPDFVNQVCDQIVRIASDIELLESHGHTPKLLIENAKHLGKIDAVRFDTVITSPPYLNGTNYFRNTKLELWFLRCLSSESDLSGFRFKAVTAGINDVTRQKLIEDFDVELAPLIAKLSEDAYDARIPQMVANYFADMKLVFSSLRNNLKQNAIVAVDIGDSAYGNTHVPTDTILKNLLSSLGFTVKHDLTLRKRLSRNSFPLRQSLIVFEYLGSRSSKTIKLKPKWKTNWKKFTRNLPHQKGEFAKRNWGHPLHSLCSYQGKMKPSLASHLVETFVPDNGRILDPFAGVGTIPFSASMAGRESIGFEISPMALHVTQAKLGELDGTICEKLISKLDKFLKRNQVLSIEYTEMEKVRFNGNLWDYFSPATLSEILMARRFFQQRPPSEANESLVFSSLLHILHGNRPYALSRRSHPITPYSPTGEFEYRALIPRLRAKVERSLSVPKPPEFRPGQVFFQDATNWWPQQVDGLDAIITSPPFFDSTRFYLANWMRLWFCGWEAKDFQTRPLAFVDERQKKSFKVYESIFRQARERLNQDGVFVLHLGKSKKCDMATELREVAAPWFKVADVFTESVDHCETHGIRDKGTVTAHQFLILN